MALCTDDCNMPDYPVYGFYRLDWPLLQSPLQPPFNQHDPLVRTREEERESE